jgi:hypothetical protein
VKRERERQEERGGERNEDREMKSEKGASTAIQVVSRREKKRK